MKRILFFALFFISACQAFSQADGLRLKHFNVKKSLAIEGYDAVSYFDGKPAEGNEKFSLKYNGIIYLFKSEANLNKFKLTPEKFEPVYGGWCAFAMGQTGEKVKVDPETFKIVGGRLYLFYNFWGSNTLEDWNKNETQLKAQADRNWKQNFR